MERFGNHRFRNFLWTYRDLSGPIGTHRDLSGHIGTYLDRSGSMWTYRDLSGPIGTYRDLSGHLSETIWTCLDLCWTYAEGWGQGMVRDTRTGTGGHELGQGQ